MGLTSPDSFYCELIGNLPVKSYEGYWGPYVYFDISVLRNAWETEIAGRSEIQFEYCELVMPGNMILPVRRSG